jgi:hypothetical protein
MSKQQIRLARLDRDDDQNVLCGHCPFLLGYLTRDRFLRLVPGFVRDRERSWQGRQVWKPGKHMAERVAAGKSPAHSRGRRREDGKSTQAYPPVDLADGRRVTILCPKCGAASRIDSEVVSSPSR